VLAQPSLLDVPVSLPVVTLQHTYSSISHQLCLNQQTFIRHSQTTLP
jgi:hypothetical protein